MSEPIKLEELVQQLIGLQKKLENAEQKLASLKQRADSGTAEAALFAIARQMAIANEDRREEKAAKEREKERQRLAIVGWLRPPRSPYCSLTQ